MDKIITKYKQLCETPSDIFEHLPVLKQYAERCAHITEMGVRTVVSTYAFLAAEPFELVCYDIARHPNVDAAKKLAAENQIKMTFHQKSVLEVEIEPTDMIFCDTYHSGLQLDKELSLHADKARKYIGLHDTHTYGLVAEPPYENIPAEVAGTEGLLWAVDRFLAKNPNWKIVYQVENNNGLTIMERSI